jgi:hypothetical protein
MHFILSNESFGKRIMAEFLFISMSSVALGPRQFFFYQYHVFFPGRLQESDSSDQWRGVCSHGSFYLHLLT